MDGEDKSQILQPSFLKAAMEIGNALVIIFQQSTNSRIISRLAGGKWNSSTWGLGKQDLLAWPYNRNKHGLECIKY